MRNAVFVAVLLGLPAAAQQADRQYTHSLLAQGIAASAPVTVQLRTVAGRMTVRNFVVGRGIAKDVPTPQFSVMELDAGHLFTTVGGTRQEHVPGDFWTVDKGTAI